MMFRLRSSLVLFLVFIGLFISKDMPQAEGRFLSDKAMRVKRHIEAITEGKYSFPFSYTQILNMPLFLILYFSIIKTAPTTKEPRISVIFAPEGLPFDFWG